MSKVDQKVELRKYLLGDLNEVEPIEKRLLIDEEYFLELEIIEEEIIQDFADGRLSDLEMTLFVKNFLITDERRKKLNFAKQLRNYVDGQPRSTVSRERNRFFGSLLTFFWSPVPIAVAVLLIVSVAGYLVWKSKSDDSEVLALLNQFQTNERPTEGRITGFMYAPKIEGVRGSQQNSEHLILVSAKAQASAEVLKAQTAENYHELGRVFLAEKNFDEAIAQLEFGIQKDPVNAQIQNDLGVALLEKARQNKAFNADLEKRAETSEESKAYLELFAKSNEAFSKAIELDKNMLEAYFNQAKTLTLMEVLPNQAKEAWDNYLKLDPDSKWADEAREHLNKIEANKPVSKTKEEILQDFLNAKDTNDIEKAWQTLSRNREMITGKLIPQQLAFLFADSKSLGDDANAKIALDGIIYAGKLEETKSGDLFWRDLAIFYENVSDKHFRDLKTAQDAVRNGYSLAKSLDYAKAQKEFETAKTIFARLGNIPEAMFCDYWLGYLLNRLKNSAESLSVLEASEKSAKSKGYKWLLGYTLCWLAINQSELGETSKSLNYYEAALNYTEEISDTQNQQKILSLIASDYKFLKRDDIALQYLQKSLELEMLPESSQRQKWRDYESLTKTFLNFRFNNTALVFGKELLNLSFQNDDISFKCDSYLTLGSVYGSLKQYEKAIEMSKKGLETAGMLSSAEERNLETANANLSLGNLEIHSGNYEPALNYFQSAASFFASSAYQSNNYQAQKGKLFCFHALKDDQSFEAELPNVLKLFEDNRSKILEEQNRNSFFDNEQDVYDIAVNYEFSKKNFRSAFDHAEKSRSRSLLDLQNSFAEVSASKKEPDIKFLANNAEPMNLEQIRTEMPSESQLLVYSVLPRKIAIWLITKEGLNVAESEIDSEQLREKVEQFWGLVSKRSGSGADLNLSSDLHDLLVLPIRGKIDPAKQLVIIPDKTLFRLPFAALYSGKYLVEDYRISYSPSANVFLNSSKKAVELNTVDSEKILTIGNPIFNAANYENQLAAIPSAGDEAREIARLYDNANALLGNDATKAEVKNALKTSDVFHFAGHYVVDQESPLKSSLILSGKTKDESNLSNYELIGEKLSKTRLIVLSACDTGIERYFNGEGMIGASRTFLATGVPLIVASQWSVDSEASKQLMVRLHFLRKVGNLATAEALRQSQIEMLKSENFKEPYFWAAFDAVGGFSQF